jgi:glycosyltransferase involved in cell wall biosynthesis
MAIESVLEQSEPRIELIVIDDASTDETHAIAQRYARTDPRVRVLRNQRNSRAGPIEWEPRNDGLRLACGEFVAYLDADNTWRPDFVARLTRVLLDDPQLQLTFCDSRNFYSRYWARRAVARDPRRLIASGPTWTVFSLDTLERDRLGVDQYIDTNELMHRADVFATLGALWRVVHPRRKEIERRQYGLRPGRRHNDLDLVERIVDAFGVDAVAHVHEVLVDYYYPSASRRLRPPPCTTTLHPQDGGRPCCDRS